jgi:hypothetical protein
MTVTIIRSPAYPNMSLGEALDQVGKIDRVYRNSNVDRVDAAKLIGYSGLSGPANKALSAFAHYWLVERAGKGMMRVTARAKAILHSDTAAEKLDNLRSAAFEPDLFRELQERFPGIIPPYEGVETFLNRKGFNQTAVRPAAKAYLDTLLFLEQSGVTESHGNEEQSDADSERPDDGGKPKFGGARVGDLIQWEINGVLQMETPMRVRLVDEVDGRLWVAVEGSETGIPMDQVIVEERAAPPPADAPRFKIEAVKPKEDESLTLAEGWKEERLIDDGGEEIFIRYRGEPTAERYTYIRDYLDFKLSRMNKAQ